MALAAGSGFFAEMAPVLMTEVGMPLLRKGVSYVGNKIQEGAEWLSDKVFGSGGKKGGSNAGGSSSARNILQGIGRDALLALPEYQRYQRPYSMGGGSSYGGSGGYGGYASYSGSSASDYLYQRKKHYSPSPFGGLRDTFLGGTPYNPYKETLGATLSEGYGEWISQVNPFVFDWEMREQEQYAPSLYRSNEYNTYSSPYLNRPATDFSNQYASFGESQLRPNTQATYGNTLDDRGYDYLQQRTYRPRYNDSLTFGGSGVRGGTQQLAPNVARPDRIAPERTSYVRPTMNDNFDEEDVYGSGLGGGVSDFTSSYNYQTPVRKRIQTTSYGTGLNIDL